MALACAHLSPLSNTYTPVKRELTPHLSAEQAAAAEPVVIPLAALISEPELFHGQRVVTEGFVTLRPEGNMVCTSAEPQKDSCLWLDIEGLKDPRFRKDRATVAGTFNGQNLGHMGMASGTLERITQMDRIE